MKLGIVGMGAVEAATAIAVMLRGLWVSRCVDKLGAVNPVRILAGPLLRRRPAIGSGATGILFACAIGLAGCASLPPLAQRAPTVALDPPADSQLAQLAAHSLHTPGDSGFQILPISYGSMAARVILADRAEKTLDVQYYELAADTTGQYFLRALYRAAKRGVRVRVLIDDLHTVGEDALLSSFADAPNVEVRLFNPFPGGRSSIPLRFARSLDDLQRANHRMHNKLFIADNTFAVMGGRNIAGEYFLRKPDHNFLDLDLLAAGPIVRDLSKSFDAYWNSEYAYPVAAIASPGPRGRSEEYFMNQTGEVMRPDPPGMNLGMERYEALVDQLHGDSVPLIEAPARVVADMPDKIAGSGRRDHGDTVRREFSALVATAQHEVIAISPYFVPGKEGIAHIAAMRERGVKVLVFTNSLASNDTILAHIGYARYRFRLLHLGVDLYELNPTQPFKRGKFGDFGASRAQLHAKLATIDGKTLFIGSMNLDNRSANLNTEVAVIVNSPELTGEVNALIDLGSAYNVRLTKDGHLQWVSSSEDYVELINHEPNTSEWERVEVELLGPLVPESML